MEHKFTGKITRETLETIFSIRVAALKNESISETFCFKNVNFIDPVGLCLLAFLCDELHEKSIEIINLELSIESYLERMGFFQTVRNVKYKDRTSSNKRNDKSSELVELKKIAEMSKIPEVSSQLSRAVIGKIPNLSIKDSDDGMTASEAELFSDNLEYVFGEILSNAIDHGQKRGHRHAKTHIAAQYYNQTNKLIVAIVDNGCGLLETLQSHSAMGGDISHKKAIEIALMPRVSCNRDGQLGLDTKNQGIGLTVSTEMAIRARGAYSIFTGDCIYSQNSKKEIISSKIPAWQGVGVVLEFDRNCLPTLARNAIIRGLPGFEEVALINFE